MGNLDFALRRLRAGSAALYSSFLMHIGGGRGMDEDGWVDSMKDCSSKDSFKLVNIEPFL